MAPDREPQLDRTFEDNDVLTIGLGAIAWLDRFAEAAKPRAAGATPPDDPLLAAALGLMSLRRSLHRWAAQAETPRPSPPPAPPLREGFLR